MSTGTLLLVGLGGALGTVLRYLVDTTVARRWPGAFPTGTLVVNLTAALLLGLLVGLTSSTTTTLVVGVGLLGGYSTFSTWMLETHRLAQDGALRLAALNVALPATAGLLAVLVGRALGRLL
ncbi:fluoride efflux transporter CrcB [Patulibacter sp.]|uniref:fluoride efflux transporter CrcB n=1 Tax=Patulibacter sp. TaxID=1912859 RepID=UPI002727C171|nr:fluoride efflux transporter CrcB [Patulibacter sp.]MDO9407731.1 fluoride efflux transporter CrcB [Patulibacter sp.]